MTIRKNLLISSSITALAFGVAHVAGAADVTWDGETSSDWFTATNWDTNTLPASGDYALLTDPAAPDVVVSGADVTLGAGRVYVDANTLTISGGSSISDDRGNIGFFAGSDGTVIVTGAGSSWVNSGALTVGNDGIGTLVIENGGMVSNGNAFVGRNGGAQGSVTVTGAGSSWVNNLDLLVGFDGTGTLSVANGATVSSTNGYIGTFLGSNGAATVSGAGSSWSNSTNLYVGYDGAGELTVANGGTVSTGTLSIGNLANGDGTVNIGGASGDPAAAAGTLSVAGVAFGSGTGELNFNHTGTNYAFAPDITGGGDVNFVSGVTRLTGDTSGFTGLTSISGGTLSVTSSRQLADIVASSGTLDLSRDNAVGTTLTVNGNLDLQSGSTLALNVTSAETNDMVSVNGTVSLGGNLRLVATGLETDYDPVGSQFVFIVIENDGVDAVTGTFANVSSNFAFLTPTLDYAAGTGNDVQLTLETSATLDFTPFALTANQKQVAAAMDGYDFTTSDGNVVHSNLSLLLNSEVPGVLDQLGGSGLLSSFTFGGAPSLAFLGTLGNHAGQGSTGGQVVSTKGGGLAAPGIVGKSAWASVFADYQTVESDGNAPGGSVLLGGFSAGSEVQIDNGMVLGAAVGYSRAAFSTDGVTSNNDANGYHAGLYGKAGAYSAFASGFGVTGAVFASLQDYSSARSISFGGLNRTASADYYGYSYGGEVIARYGVPESAFGGVIAPFGGLRYQNTHTNGFTETGAGGLNLTVSPVNHDQVTTIVGVEHAGSHDTALGMVDHRVSLSWEHDVLATGGSADFALGGSATPFTLQTADMGANTLVIGGGVAMDLAGRGAINLDGKAEVSATGIGLGAGVSYKLEF